MVLSPKMFTNYLLYRDIEINLNRSFKQFIIWAEKHLCDKIYPLRRYSTLLENLPDDAIA